MSAVGDSAAVPHRYGAHPSHYPLHVPVGDSAVGKTSNDVLIDDSADSVPITSYEQDNSTRPLNSSPAQSPTSFNIHQSESPSDVYVRILLAEKLGYPLWNPGPSCWPPEYRRRGVSIGDIGVITFDGRFKFLFNACLSAVHPVNCRAPSTFIPFDYSEDEVERIPEAFPSGAVIKSGSIQEGATPPQGNETTSDFVKFTCSSDEGALLILPDGTSRIDLAFRKNLLQHAKQHAQSWFDHVYGILGPDAEADSLYLVTGADKCRSWCLAAHSKTSGHMSHQYTQGSQSDPGVTQLYSWTSSSSGSAIAEDQSQVYANQCVFIRGYRITPSQKLVKRMFAGDSPSPHASSRSNSILGTTMKQWFSRTTSKGPEGAGLRFTTATIQIPSSGPELYHPSNIINNSLLNSNPSADFAITHDDVWLSVLAAQGTRTPDAPALLSRVTARFEVVNSNRCLLLIPREQTDFEPAFAIDHTVISPRDSVFPDPDDDVRDKFLLERENISPLHSAVYAGDQHLIRLLLENADPNTRDSGGLTPLGWAVVRENEDAVRTLLKSGANANIRDKDGRKPMHHLREYKNEAIMDLLMERTILGTWGQVALHWAANRGEEGKMRKLLVMGVPVDARDESGRTALHLAAQGGKTAAIELLLKSDADIHARDSYGRTALHSAAWKGNNAVITQLLEKGVDVDSRDVNGGTPLHWAVLSGNENTVNWLLDRGVDIKVRNNFGTTVLHWAAERGDKNLVRLLLEKGVDAGARDIRGRMALHCAAWKGNNVMIDELLERGMDINARDDTGGTTLHWAAKSGKGETIKLLLDKGVDVDARDNDGLTAFQWATQSGSPMAIGGFLDSGASCEDPPAGRATSNM